MTEKPELVEKFKELHFDAGHYLKQLVPCDKLHGHTYVLKDLELSGTLEGDILVDFGAIKSLMKEYDHSLLIPIADENYWARLKELGPTPFKLDKIVSIRDEPTVERIGLSIAQKILKAHSNIWKVSFTIFEGINQGVKVEVSK
jgi:6-pyruvoyl-tetrahydropterin synthase